MSAPAYDPETTSTNYDPAFTLESLFPAYALQYDDGTVEIRRNYLGRVVRVLRYITVYTPYVWNETDVLTTVVYNFYGNTTLVHLVMIYNSITHRLEILPNRIVKLPDLGLIKQYLSNVGINTQNQVSNIGKIIKL